MIVIIGGGIIGASIAYYLSKRGIGDITLIEKEKLLGTGVTQFCSGGIRSQFSTAINVKLSIKSIEELKSKEIGFKKLGYLILDMEDNSMPRVKMQNSLGVLSEYLTPLEIKKRFPYINAEGVKSGSFCPEDGIANPSLLLSIYEKGAKEKGVKFLMETNVKKILMKSGRICGVLTDKGEILAEKVILAAGVGSIELGKTINLDIPIVHIRKYVLVIDGFPFDFPLTMEIPTGWYIKKEGDDALVGMSGKDEKIPFERQKECVDETIEASLKRFPLTEKSGIKKILSSMSDEIPDKHAIIDNSIPNLIIATGFSGHGFMHSPVAGEIVASLVVDEKPEIDISCLKLKREIMKENLSI